MRISDWSSDVCSSDLPTGKSSARPAAPAKGPHFFARPASHTIQSRWRWIRMTAVAVTAAEWERESHAALRDGRHVAAREAVLRAASLRASAPRTIAGVVSLLAALYLGEALVRYVAGLGPLDRISVPLVMTTGPHFHLSSEQLRAGE